MAGWKVVGSLPPEVKKAVMIAAPHTSNWDLLYARAAFYILGIPVRFTIKKELMKFPLKGFLNALGAIAIDRNPNGLKKVSMVDAMAELFNQKEELVILVTPEGTRSYAPKWKTGFYRVAEMAQVPIVLGYLDYQKKHAGIGPVIYPNGDIDGQMEEMLAFYRNVTAKFPEKGVK